MGPNPLRPGEIYGHLVSPHKAYKKFRLHDYLIAGKLLMI